MKHFKDANGGLHSFEDSVDSSELLKCIEQRELREISAVEFEGSVNTSTAPKLAKGTRDEVIESNIVLTGTSAEYQIDAAARANIAVALRKAEDNGYPDTEVRDWRLADNSWRETTLGELKQLLNQYDERFESVWHQFNIWDSGDRSVPFEVEL